MTPTFLPAPVLPPGRPLLVVTGFMGTGKTLGGARAADILGVPFFDLDEVVARRAGRPVPELIVDSGEAAFRDLEREALMDAARLSGAVVATGGGAVLDGPAFAALSRNACVAVLTCDPEEVARRVGQAERRPLLARDPARRIEELLRERARAYAEAGTGAAARATIDTSHLGPEEVGRELASANRALVPAGRPARIRVESTDFPYEVHVGEGVVDELAAPIAELLPEARTAAVVFDPAAEPVLERVSRALRGAGLRVRELPVPSGERSKSIGVVDELWSRFRDAGLEPTDVVVAVGGGATLDTAGFAAATYARGVDLINVPTTLLAMADAALGGKVGIDHAGVKNLVGSFHHPRLVAADPSTLATLPRRAVRAGLAEVVKAAVLASPLVLDELERAAGSFDDHRPLALEWIVEQSVRIKAAYVAEDPWDRGPRHALNLGHTFAHALEAATGYALPHGEAVSIGLVAAARLGTEIGSTPADLPERLRALLTGLGLPTEPPDDVDAESVVAAMAGDKKRQSGRAVFVLPAPGGAELATDVPPERALSALFGRSPQGTRR